MSLVVKCLPIITQALFSLNHEQAPSLGWSWSNMNVLWDAESIVTHNPACESSAVANHQKYREVDQKWQWLSPGHKSDQFQEGGK